MAEETQPRPRPEAAAGAADRGARAPRSGRERPLEPGLHLLSTPIGAADDITLRGLDALRQADALACEDTRMLRKLMDLHGIDAAGRPMIAYHEHNAETARPKILARLAAGDSVVYASDAGTPLIADPGYKLVAAAREAGHAVSALPGPSAALAALVLSGLPTDAFAFLGFPPPKPGPRRRLLQRWADAPASLVLFEAPHRVAETLADLREVLGETRRAALARELTKRHEEVATGSLGALADRFAAGPTPKGELVLVIGPPEPTGPDEAAIEALLRRLLPELSVKDAVGTVVERLGAPRKMVYAKALALKGMDHGETPPPRVADDQGER